MSKIQNPKNIILTDKIEQPINNSQEFHKTLLVKDLGWTEDETKESYYRLKHCENDWNIADMDVYDQL